MDKQQIFSLRDLALAPSAAMTLQGLSGAKDMRERRHGSAPRVPA